MKNKISYKQTINTSSNYKIAIHVWVFSTPIVFKFISISFHIPVALAGHWFEEEKWAFTVVYNCYITLVFNMVNQE
jgi:hypothetical protein